MQQDSGVKDQEEDISASTANTAFTYKRSFESCTVILAFDGFRPTYFDSINKASGIDPWAAETRSTRIKLYQYILHDWIFKQISCVT